jgi:hypothetical protein
MTFSEIAQVVHESKVTPANPPENGIIRVLVKTHYGRNHYYPANPTAELFRKIQGGKTLTEASLKALKDADYAIQYRYEEPAI